MTQTTDTAPRRTPWGQAQHHECVADGIIFVSTASHGGFWLSPARRAAMPDTLRTKGVTGTWAWYEEDCEAALVVLGFPEAFPPDAYGRAYGSVRNWYPAIFEAHTGDRATPENSYMLAHPDAVSA